MTTEPTTRPSGDLSLDYLADQTESSIEEILRHAKDLGENRNPDVAKAVENQTAVVRYLRDTATKMASQQNRIARMSSLLMQLDRRGGLGSHTHEQIRETLDAGPSAGYLAVHAAAQVVVAEIARYRRELGDRLADVLLLMARQVTG